MAVGGNQNAQMGDVTAVGILNFTATAIFNSTNSTNDSFNSSIEAPTMMTTTTSDNPEDITLTLDKLDLPAAILYLVFNLIMVVPPITVFYTVTEPIISAWPENHNVVYIVSRYMLWISNIVLYGLPTLVGGFTWLWNAYIIGGYVAWTQYLVVWGGTIMQLINFIMIIAGAWTFNDEYSTGFWDSQDGAFTQWGIWTIATAGCYVGYWLLNDYFLEYYVIEEINHKISPTQTEVKVDDQAQTV